MADEEVKHKVQLAVYDLTQGMAKQLGPALLGIEVEGVWHTGVVVYGKEHFFGGGIVSVPHAEFLQSYHMQPTQMLDLGETEIPEEIFDDWLREISPRFTVETYDLLRHNCNNFSDEAVTFLLGTGIPRHIVELPEQIFSTPLGMMLRPMVEQMQTSMRPGIPGFESYGAEPPPFSAQPPPMPLPMPMPFGNFAAPAPPLANPWATPVAPPAPAPATAPARAVPSPSSTQAPPPALSPPKASILSAHAKLLLSSDPPAALEKSLSIVTTKLRSLASPPLDETDEALLSGITSAVLKSLPLPPASLSLAYRVLTEWPPKAHFSCLSLLRLLLLQPSAYPPLPASPSDLMDVLKHLLLKLSDPAGFGSSKPANIMALCSLSNALSHPTGQALLLASDNASLVVDAGLTALKDDRPEVRQMGSALLANQALAMEGREEYKGPSDVAVQTLCGCLEGLGGEGDGLTLFRRLLCVGRLVKVMGPEGAELVTSLGFDDTLRAAGQKKGGEVADLSAEILAMLKS